MSKIDWSKAPEGAEFAADGLFYKYDKGLFYWSIYNEQWIDSWLTILQLAKLPDYEPRPTEWPSEQRIDIIGTNGNDGLVYGAPESTQSDLINNPASAADFLSEGLKILSERGNQYGSNQRECSFPQAAEAFNAITGHSLKGSDVCLIIALVKQVRQYAQPRFHGDSAVDAVNYLALQAELLKKERK